MISTRLCVLTKIYCEIKSDQREAAAAFYGYGQNKDNSFCGRASHDEISLCNLIGVYVV
jgi:hypothetical protein